MEDRQSVDVPASRRRYRDRPSICQCQRSNSQNLLVKPGGKSVGEARSLVPTKYSATTKSEVAESSGETGSSWPGATVTTSAATVAVAKSVDEARLPGIAKYSATQNADDFDVPRDAVLAATAHETLRLKSLRLNNVPAQRPSWRRQSTRPSHQIMKRCGTSTRPGSGKYIRDHSCVRWWQRGSESLVQTRLLRISAPV